MRPAVIALTLLTALAIAPAAPAATPTTVGSGERPQIAVGVDGRGHVAWTIPGDGVTPAKVGYCRIPVGGNDCEVVRTLDFPAPGVGAAGSEAGDLSVFAPSATKVVITTACSPCFGDNDTRDHMTVFASVDGGTTWGAPGNANVTPTVTGLQGGSTWVDGAGLGLAGPLKGLLAGPAEGTSVIGAGVGVPPLTAPPLVGARFVFSPSVVRVPDTPTMMVYASNDLGAVRYAVYDGPNLNQNSVGMAWSKTDQALSAPESGAAETQLNAGPGGVTLTYLNQVPQDDHVVSRTFNRITAEFGPATFIEGSDPIDAGIGAPDSSQDAAGSVHVVWSTGYGDGRLRYIRSAPTPTRFTAPANIAGGESFGDPEVGAGPSGAGWAVWQGAAGAEGAGGPGPPAGPAAAPPAAPPPPATPAPPAAARAVPVGRQVRSSVPGASVDFGLPKGCVQPGQTFRVTLKWKRKKQKGNKFVKVTRADFYIGTKVVKKDRKAPFVQTLKVTASARRGSTIKLRARAFIKVKKGKAPKKSIRATIKVCP